MTRCASLLSPPQRRDRIPQTLTEEFISQVTRSSPGLRISKKKGILFHQGQPITSQHFLCRGLAKLTKVMTNGDEVILEILIPCALLGELTCEREAVHSYSAEILEDSYVVYVKHDNFLSLIQSHPHLLGQLNYHLASRLTAAYKMQGLMKRRVKERLLAVMARTLLLLQERDKRISLRNLLFPLSFTEIAQYAQTSPETTSRILHQLGSDGIVTIERNALKIIEAEQILSHLPD